MSIQVKSLVHAGDFLFVCGILGLRYSASVDPTVDFLYIDGKERFQQKYPALQHVLGKTKKSPFNIGTAEEKVAMEKWIAAASHPLPALNQALVAVPYIAGTSEPSIADLVVYHRTHAAASSVAPSGQSALCNFFRWFDLIQHLPCVRSAAEALPIVPVDLPFSISPVVLQSAAAVKKAVSEKKAVPVTTAAPAAPKAEKPVAPPAADMDISKLDIRVGLISKCWIHPDAEKLLCEEIEVGESEPRKISSGLRAFYTPEQMTNRKVLVLCNLKAMSLVGFKSHGMVLCASNDDHSKVELLDPPAGAAVGEKVIFEGFSGEPAPENHIQKKKILEAVLPDFRTTDACLAAYRGVVGQTSAGPAKAPSLANMHIS